MKFELIAGKHSNRNGHYTVGDIVTSDSNLETIFKNKFKRRGDLEHGTDRAEAPARTPSKPAPSTARLAPRKTTVPAPKATTPATAPAPQRATPDNSGEVLKSELGDDVSSDFKGLSTEWAVLKNKKNQFFLVDRDKPADPINEMPTNKAGIEALIKKLTA